VTRWDALLEELAGYASTEHRFGAETLATARLVLADSLGCAALASTHAAPRRVLERAHEAAAREKIRIRNQHFLARVVDELHVGALDVVAVAPRVAHHQRRALISASRARRRAGPGACSCGRWRCSGCR